MSKYKVKKTIAWHGTHEAGSVIEITDDEAAAFGPEYVEAVKDEAQPSSDEQTDDESKKPKKK